MIDGARRVSCAVLSVFWAMGVLFAAPVRTGAQENAPPTYRIETDDELEISVLGEPDLLRKVTVLPDGKIAYPYGGEIRVAGMTVPELTELITTRLKAQLVRPQVTVSVNRRQERSVSVLGAVKTPGKKAIRDGWRILDVLAETGGLSVARPEWTTALLVRAGGREAIPVDLAELLSFARPAQNLPIAPGDILIVRERDAVQTQLQVIGEVEKPGAYPVASDGSVTAAIAAAGGIKPTAALSKAVVRRGGTSIPIDLRKLAETGESDPAVTLLPGDTLVVPQNTRRVAVLGAVTRSGAVDYPEDRVLDVVAALSLAGGHSADADLKNVTLVHFPDPAGSESGRAPQFVPINLWKFLTQKEKDGKGAPSDYKAIAMAPGDILFVPGKGTNRPAARDLLNALPLISFMLR